MIQNDADQERVANIIGNVVQSGVTIGAQLAMIPRNKPVKVEISTAAHDVQTARQELKKGKSLKDISQAILQSSVAKGIAKAGGDVGQYIKLVVQRAEIKNATERMPSTARQQTRTRKKTL